MRNFIKYHFLAAVFFHLFFTSGKAQNNPAVDSLLKAVTLTADEKEQANLLIRLSKEYVTVDIKKAAEFAKRSISLSKKINYAHGEIEGINLLSIIDINQGKYAEALIKLKSALNLAEKTKDLNAAANCFLSIGDIYSILKNNETAIDNYQQSLELFSKNGNKAKCITSLNRIANRNMDIGNARHDTAYFFKAIKIYSKAFAIALSINDNVLIINSYVNIADAYNILGETTKNKTYFFHSLDNSLHGLRLARTANNINYEALNYLNIGDTYDKLKMHSKAIHFYETALSKYEQIANKNWILNTYTFLAKSYYSLNNFEKAIEYTNKGIDIAKEQRLLSDLRCNYQLLSDIYVSKKDYQNALAYNTLAANYKDSLVNENSAIKVASLQAEFEFQRKNQEIQLLTKNTELQEQQINAQVMQRNYLIAAILIVIILLIIIYYRYREKNKVQLEIIRAKESAEHAKELQEQFLANTSHEIRTPMNGIIGMTNHLKETALTNEQREYIGAISDSAGSLLVLINDLLDLSKINAGKMTFNKKAFKISDLFKNLIYSLQYRSVEKNILLVSTIDEKIPSVLIGDAEKLNQILLNLTGNAVKFTEKGEVKITAKLLKDDGKNLLLLFSVHDTGIGIQENKIDTIFESFTQANAQTNRKYGGTGLGLTIAKQLIEQQGGTISVSSKVNEGSTFSFTLQLQRQLKEQHTVDTLLDYSQRDLRSISVLVVDDNKINQRVAALTLQKWNAKVDLADNALHAYEKLHAHKYDLILMDVTMPEIDGFEATKYIRKKLHAPINKIPIIAMTAAAFTGDREKCIAAGMNEYISKPFVPEDLYKKIALLIADHAFKQAVYNLASLTERSEGDNTYLAAIINSYVQEMPLYSREMKNYVQQRNLNGIAAQAHKMKSPAKLLGAFELHQQLEFIERHIEESGLTVDLIQRIELSNRLCIQTVDELKMEAAKIR